MARNEDVGYHLGNNFRYIDVRAVGPLVAADNKVVIWSKAAVDASGGYVALALGQCAVLGVGLVIGVNAPYYERLVAYQNNVEEVLQL